LRRFEVCLGTGEMTKAIR